MHVPAFDPLPDHSRLWLQALAAPCDPAALAPGMDALLARWRHKGVAYRGAWTLLEGRILAVAEPLLADQPSGCAIDGLLRGLAKVVAEAGLSLEAPDAVLVRREGGLQAVPRAELQARLAEGLLGAATPVLDLALLTLGDLRQGRLERPLATTWIGRKYKIEAPAEPGPRRG